jgi:DNA-binding transcriptional LysR family regulator
VTLAQLKVFVLVARLGSVRAAAAALGVSEPAVSQALAALRQHLDDPLITRSASTMELTAAGRRVVSIASQMVNLAAEAEEAVRQSNGAPELVRVVTTSTLSHSVVPALMQAFTGRTGNVEVNLGVASTEEMLALVQERMADVAIGPPLHGVESEPIMRYRLVVVAAPKGAGVAPPAGGPRWLVGPAGTDPHSDIGQMLAKLKVSQDRVQVYASDAAAWAAAADGEGVAPAVDHLVAPQVDRGRLVRLPLPGGPPELMWHVNTLSPDRRTGAASKLRNFMRTPEAMQAMYRADSGVPASKFRPPVYVTIWS